MRRWVLWVVISCELGASGSAYAQDTERALLTSAAVLSIHQPGESDSPYLSGPFGGTAPGVVIGIQVPRSRGFRAGFEVGLGRSIQGSQEQRAGFQGTVSLLTTHRDTTFSGLIAWTRREEARARPTAVGGVTLALRHTVRHTVAVRDPRQPSGPLRPDEIFDDAAIGLAGGVDIPVRITPRLDLIPTVRVHWLFDKDRTQDGVVKRGISSVFTRLGLGVGVRF